jgi:hypothetical protein
MYLRNPIQSQTCKDIEYKQVIGADLSLYLEPMCFYMYTT